MFPEVKGAEGLMYLRGRSPVASGVRKASLAPPRLLGGRPRSHGGRSWADRRCPSSREYPSPGGGTGRREAPGAVAMLVRHDCKDSQMEVEIGRGKSGRRAYGFDDIAIVPSRRTRDPDDIDISWKLGPYQFELPLDGLRDGRRRLSSDRRDRRSAWVAWRCSTWRASSLATRTLRSSSSGSPSCPRTWPRARCKRSTPSR